MNIPVFLYDLISHLIGLTRSELSDNSKKIIINPDNLKFIITLSIA